MSTASSWHHIHHSVLQDSGEQRLVSSSVSSLVRQPLKMFCHKHIEGIKDSVVDGHPQAD